MNREAASDYLDSLDVVMTPEDVVKCIGYCKQAMLAGECSVEAYYAAKELLFDKLEPLTPWTN